MPQLPLFGPAPAFGLTITFDSDPLRPEKPVVVTIRTRDAHGATQRMHSYSLVDIELDFAGELARAIVDGYLYGDSWVSPFISAERLRREAREHRLRHGR